MTLVCGRTNFATNKLSLRIIYNKENIFLSVTFYFMYSFLLSTSFQQLPGFGTGPD